MPAEAFRLNPLVQNGESAGGEGRHLKISDSIRCKRSTLNAQRPTLNLVLTILRR
jgi:hypothetical protein